MRWTGRCHDLRREHGAAQARMVPDYYARLGVDSGSDPAEIEAALKKQQPAWSMGTRNPKTRHTNQLYLDEVPALRRALLSGPEARAAYDAELAAVQIAEREQKLDELQRRVRLRGQGGAHRPPIGPCCATRQPGSGSTAMSWIA